jgi:hypothetical protein
MVVVGIEPILQRREIARFIRGRGQLRCLWDDVLEDRRQFTPVGCFEDGKIGVSSFFHEKNELTPISFDNRVRKPSPGVRGAQRGAISRSMWRRRAGGGDSRAWSNAVRSSSG